MADDNQQAAGTTTAPAQPDENVQAIKALRVEIDALVQKVKAKADERPAKGGAEFTLSFRALQMAKMWLGKVLEEQGNPFPAELADKAK